MDHGAWNVSIGQAGKRWVASSWLAPRHLVASNFRQAGKRFLALFLGRSWKQVPRPPAASCLGK